MKAKKSRRKEMPEKSPGRPSTRPTAGRSTTTINWRIVVWTLIGLFAGGGGAWLWHSWQVKDFASGAMQQGRELVTSADTRDADAQDLLEQAQDLLAEARQLEADGRIADADSRRKKAQEIFDNSRKLAEESFQDRRAAMQFFLRYTQLNPADPEGPLALARLSEHNSTSYAAIRTAVDWYDAALRAAPEMWSKKGEARVGRAGLLLGLGQAAQRDAARTGKLESKDQAAAWFREASEEAKTALDQATLPPKNETEANRVRALALFGLHELGVSEGDLPQIDSVESVGDSLEQAHAQAPSDTDLALALAQVYREFPELLSDDRQAAFQLGEDENGNDGYDWPKLRAAADSVMRELVETTEARLADGPLSDRARSEAANAYIGRYRYLSRYELPGAEADLRKALELAPASAVVRLLAGWHAIEEAKSTPVSGAGNIAARKEKLEEARGHFLEAKNLQFDDARVYLGLAETYRLLGKPDDLIETLRLGLQNAGANNWDKWDLNYALLDFLIDSRRLTEEEAKERFKRLDDVLAQERPRVGQAAWKSLDARHDLLRARWLAQAGRLDAATQLLDEIVTTRGLADSKAEQSINRDEYVALLLLAQCYEAQARESRLETAQAMDAAKKLETASGESNLKEISDAADAARTTARQLFRRAAETYEQLARRLPATSQFRAAAARAHLQAGQPDMAVLDLDMALETDDSIGLHYMMARARLDQAKGAGAPAHILELVQKELDTLDKRVQGEPIAQPWTVEVFRAELLGLKNSTSESTHTPDEAISALRKLEEEYPMSIDLRAVLAQRYSEYGATKEIERLAASREMIVALTKGDIENALVAEERLTQSTGDSSLLWRLYHVSRLLLEHNTRSDKAGNQIEEAEEAVDDILKEHSDSGFAHALSSDIKRAKGDNVGAIEELEQASRLQPTNLKLLEQLIRTELQVGDIDAAESRIAEARADYPNSEGLLKLETLIKRSTGDQEAAIALAREDVANNPADPASRLRLGALLLEADQADEAEKTFRDALLLDPDNPRPMSALFALYARTRKMDRAAEMLMEIASSEDLKPQQRELILARGYEELARPDQAKDHYQKAEVEYRNAIEIDPKDIGLRLGLAELLLRGDDPARFDRCEVEIQKGLEVAPESADARRMLARVLWRRNNGDDRVRAVAIYDSLAADSVQASETDRYRRAQMLESLGRFEEAGQAFDEVVQSTALNATALSQQIGRYLRTGQFSKAESELKRLERMAPTNLTTIALRLRLLHETGRDEEIEPIVTALEHRLKRSSTTPQQAAKINQLIGELYSSVEMHSKAEQHFRQVADATSDGMVRLATCVAAQGRTTEGIDMILSAGENVDDVTKVTALCRVFANSTPGDKDWKATEPVLLAAVGTYHDNASLLFQIANVYIKRGESRKAIELLEKAARLDPNNVGVLNNLAVLLSEQRERAQDALKYINQGIQISSHAPGLLDTKGTILLQLDRPEEAAAVLDQAVVGNKQDPRFMFHLAVACDRIGNEEKAKAMLQEAITRGLERPEYILTPVDKAWLSELREKFAPGRETSQAAQ